MKLKVRPITPARVSIGDLKPGDKFKCSPDAHVLVKLNPAPMDAARPYMVGDDGGSSDRVCMLVSSPTAQPGLIVHLARACEVIKVEVVS